MSVQQTSKHELVTKIRERYLAAPKARKTVILDEFVLSTGYHRKHAIALLRGGAPPPRHGHGGRPRRYGPAVIDALRTAAAEADWLCGKRLQPFLPEWLAELARAGRLELEDAVRAELLAMSAATIDRRLAPYRPSAALRGLSTTKPGSLLKAAVPVQTYTPWSDQRPGFLEIDLVAHCGMSTAGHYLNTLTMTDVATGWTECIGVWGKGQAAVFSGLETIRARLPFPLLGIDSDNGSEFLNAHLVRYCEREQVTFTRCRPYWKNDQAHVEQKNWSVVRRLVGYHRYESEDALAQLNQLYDWIRLWINHWQPSLKLVGKVRDGAKVTKQYAPAQTPYQRVRAAGVATDPVALEVEHAAHFAPEIRCQLAAAQEKLWPLHVRPAALKGSHNAA